MHSIYTALMSLLYKALIFKIFKIFAKNAKGFEALTLMFRTFGGNLRTDSRYFLSILP